MIKINGRVSQVHLHRNITAGRLINLGYKFNCLYGDGIIFSKNKLFHYFDFFSKDHGIMFNKENELLSGQNVRLIFRFTVPELKL